MSEKEMVLEAINKFDDNAKIEDILFEIYVQYRIKLGLQDIEEGRFLSAEQLLEEMENW